MLPTKFTTSSTLHDCTSVTELVAHCPTHSLGDVCDVQQFAANGIDAAVTVAVACGELLTLEIFVLLFTELGLCGGFSSGGPGLPSQFFNLDDTSFVRFNIIALDKSNGVDANDVGGVVGDDVSDDDDNIALDERLIPFC